ncbi:MAG: D-alanine--D-alanine ligase, partial [Marinovum sp.]|nr:D-alanine--D-alanine ligase [Marinovum sp.]
MGISSGKGPRVAVLMGGHSLEREVSLVSGQACSAALRGKDFQVIELDAGRDVVQGLSELRPDVVFNALHGRWGEDGSIQGLLEWLRIPYTHSGVMASALAMDKQRSKHIFSNSGLPTAPGFMIDKSGLLTSHPLDKPYVVKPINEGSSIGVYFVNPKEDPPLKVASDMPSILMVEEYIPGRELTVTVMGKKALAVTDIITQNWYDYDAKYKKGGSIHEVPAKIPKIIQEKCLEYALSAHELIGCRGISRADFRWDESLG